MLGMIAHLVAGWRAALLGEILEVRGLMRLLMKRRNGRSPWTPEEKAQLTGHLKQISKTVPVVVLFCLPGGSLFLPLLAFLADRRKTRRLETPDEHAATDVVDERK